MKDPKTASSKSTIDLDDTVNEKINKLIGELKKTPGYNDNWFIFGGEKPINSTSISRAVERYFKKANINKHIKLHGFRHSCATWLYSIGIPIAVISKILRHKNINETLKTYTHLLKQDYENELTKINQIRKSS